jgi:hypothetical protein
MRKHLLGMLMALLAFTSMVFVYQKSRRLAGAVEAHVDLSRGKYIIKAAWRLAAEKDVYNEVLGEFGVEMVAAGGCTITDELREELLGYNSVSVDAISERFGDEIWQRLNQRFGPHSEEREREKDREFARQCKLQEQGAAAE